MSTSSEPQTAAAAAEGREKRWDVWRDSPVRYLGYANEVGEAFAPLFRKILLPSYGVAIAYVLGDTYDKSLRAYRAQLSEPSPSIDYTAISKEAGDSFLWQMLASVTIPGLTIKGITKAATSLMNNAEVKKTVTKNGRLYFPTVIGLVTIPFIIEPIDLLVDHIMDNTYRPYFKRDKA